MSSTVRKRIFLALASTVVVALAFTGGYLVATTRSEAADPPPQVERWDLSVYFCVGSTTSNVHCRHQDATGEQRALVLEQVKLSPAVQDATYESRDEAYRRYVKKFADTAPEMIGNTKPGDLPDSLRVVLNSRYDLAPRLAVKLMDLPGVDQVIFDGIGDRDVRQRLAGIPQ
jgi:cell division protein FtsX